jgi:PPM family protein phosphatase
MFWKKQNKSQGNLNSGPLENPDSASINVVIKTDLGNIRTNNEDNACFIRFAEENIIREKGYLLIVADGMGGHQAGELASKMAVDIIGQEYFKRSNKGNIEKLLYKAFSYANKQIYEASLTNPAARGMGTTCTAIVILGDHLFFAHAGDSRAYLYKNNSITRLTEDHTYVRDLVKNGDLTEAEAETHPERNILSNAMGTKPDMRIDTGKYPFSFEQTDRILVCSDGLYDYLNDNEIAEILNNSGLEDAAGVFIAEAKRRGGKDNITVALAERSELAKPLGLKLTREVDLNIPTREIELPSGIN